MLKPSKNRNFASPSDKYNIDRGEGISKLFKKLGVNDKEEEGIMVVHYTYEWWEGELLGRRYGTRMRVRKRPTTDILLFGPTSLEQISVSVVDPGDFVHVVIDVPAQMLSASRNSHFVGSKQGGFFGPAESMISSRVTCAQHAISQFQQQFNGGKAVVEGMIRMPEPVY